MSSTLYSDFDHIVDRMTQLNGSIVTLQSSLDNLAIDSDDSTQIKPSNNIEAHMAAVQRQARRLHVAILQVRQIHMPWLPRDDMLISTDNPSDNDADAPPIRPLLRGYGCARLPTIHITTRLMDSRDATPRSLALILGHPGDVTDVLEPTTLGLCRERTTSPQDTDSDDVPDDAHF